MADLNIVFQLDQIYCRDPGESVSAEPYLWTLFFKADGETLTFVKETGKLRTWVTRTVTDEADGDLVDSNHQGHKPPPGGFHHHTVEEVVPPQATIEYKNAFKGDLNTRDVRAENKVPVPEAIGRWDTKLRRIPITINGKGVADVSPFIGCVVVLMEEDNTPDGAIDQGHLVFNNEIAAGINAILDSISVTIPDNEVPDPGKILGGIQDMVDKSIAALQDKVGKDVEDKVKENVGWGSWVFGGGDMDDTIGTSVFKYTYDDIVKAPNRRIDFWRPWGQPMPPNFKVGDDGWWELTGHIQAV